MVVRECDGCGLRLREYELTIAAGRSWVVLSDAAGWCVDACVDACGESLLLEHLQEVNELAVVR